MVTGRRSFVLITANFPGSHVVSSLTFEGLVRKHAIHSRGWIPIDNVPKAIDEMVFLLSRFGGIDVVLPSVGSLEDRARGLFLAMDRHGVVDLSRDDGKPVGEEIVEA